MMKKIHHSDVQEQIFKAAIAEIAQHGIHRAGMAGIAKACHISPSNIYNYFVSKDELLNSLYLWIKQKESDYVFNSYPEFGTTQERFYAVYKRMFEFYIQNQDYYNFLQQTFLIHTIRKDVIDKAFSSFIVLKLLFIEGQKEGIFFPGDPILQMIMVGGVLSSVMKYIIVGTLHIDQLDKEYILLSMREVVKK